jgi:hypothetical protein
MHVIHEFLSLSLKYSEEVMSPSPNVQSDTNWLEPLFRPINTTLLPASVPPTQPSR